MPRIKNLEQIMQLESIPLFLTPIDVTNALCKVHNTYELADLMSTVSKKPPFKSSVKAMMPSLAGNRVFAKVPKGARAIYRAAVIPKMFSGLSKEESGALIHVTIAMPLFEFVNPLSEEEVQNSVDPAFARRVNQYISRMPEVLFPVLRDFIEKASDNFFSDYNKMEFEQFCSLIKADKLHESMRENGLASAFALYLQAHLDPRIQFLSLFFSERDPARIMKANPWLSYCGQDEDIKYILKKSLESGSKALDCFKLSEDTFYQPDSEVGILMRRSAGVYNWFVKKYVDTNESQRQTIDELEDKLRKQRVSLDEAYADRDAAVAHNKQLQADLETRKQPVIDKDAAFKKLEKEYQKLAGQRSHEETAKMKFQQQCQSLKGRNASLSKQVEDTNAELKRLEGEVIALRQERIEWQRLPRLKDYFREKAALVVAFPDVIESYKRNAEEIFGLVEMAKCEDFPRGDFSGFDIIILTQGTPHKNSQRYASQHPNVIFYNDGGPNQLHKFLYDRFIDNSE